MPNAPDPDPWGLTDAMTPHAGVTCKHGWGTLTETTHPNA
jgi:hypothetical protein